MTLKNRRLIGAGALGLVIVLALVLILSLRHGSSGTQSGVQAAAGQGAGSSSGSASGSGSSSGSSSSSSNTSAAGGGGGGGGAAVPAGGGSTTGTQAGSTVGTKSLFTLAISRVGISVPVIGAGVVNGALDAPFGPLGSAVWKEGFWLNIDAQPGQHGTMLVAGHLDDTAGRPAAFWTLKDVRAGDTVVVVQNGTTYHYRVTETDIYSTSQANSRAILAKIYGPPAGGTDDGTARLTLVTCTGDFTPGHGYDHRVVVYGVLAS